MWSLTESNFSLIPWGALVHEFHHKVGLEGREPSFGTPFYHSLTVDLQWWYKGESLGLSGS